MILTEYFADSELSCRCGCGAMPPFSHVRRLYAFRILLNSPVYINSCARCRKHNLEVGGAEGSMHLFPAVRRGESTMWAGGASDLDEKTWERAGMSQMDLVHEACKVGFRGFGLGRNFLHIDDAGCLQLRIWSY